MNLSTHLTKPVVMRKNIIRNAVANHISSYCRNVTELFFTSIKRYANMTFSVKPASNSLSLNAVVLSTIFLLLSIAYSHIATAQVTPLKTNFETLYELPLNANPVSSITTTADINTAGDELKPNDISNRISLGICNEANLCHIQGLVTFTASVNITYKLFTDDPNDPPHTLNNIDLTITYNPQTGQSYIEKSTYLLYGAYEVTVTPITYSSTDNNILSALCLYNDMDFTRRWNMASSAVLNAIPQLQALFSTTNQTIDINWTFMSWASEYELEWIWVDDYNLPGSSSTFIAPANLPYSFNQNWERVTLKTNTYSLNTVFEHGYVIFRVRAVGMGGPQYTHRVTGTWSLPNASGTVGQVINSHSDDCIATSPHFASYNWQYEVNYAEDGKRKEVVSYFDGSLRARQSVTLSNSENTALVAESFYDHAGRKAISTLPVPAFSSILGYYTEFTLNSANKTFAQQDFDRDAFESYCSSPGSTITLNNQAGASKYYSLNNPDVSTAMHQYIPDAKLYPYTHTEYTPDNTGRVRRQSGVGPDHALASGRATSYLYATPEQNDLDRLLGTNVGFAAHYKKNTVTDANGQTSVSYLDASDKVIATALIGNAPPHMEALSSNATFTQQDNLIPPPVSLPGAIKEDQLHIVREILVESDNSDYKFKYELTTKELTEQCPVNFCSECVYDLEISLRDDCNQEMMPGGVPIVRTIGKLPPEVTESAAIACDNVTAQYKFSTDDQLTSFLDANGFITIQNLAKGQYTLSKKLKVNKDAIDYYTKKYLEKAEAEGCLPGEEELLQQIMTGVDLTDCDINCETCKDQLGTLQQFKDSYKADYNITTLTQQQETYLSQVYDFRIQQCDVLCNKDDKCRSYLMSMMAHVSPGGQYALYGMNSQSQSISVINQSFSIFALCSRSNRTTIHTELDNWVNALSYNVDTMRFMINGFLKPLSQITPNELFTNWQPEWAYRFATIHPEYCHYLRCVEETASNEFDAEMINTPTWDEAFAKGFLNPLRLTDDIDNVSSPLTPLSAAKFFPTSPTRNEDPFGNTTGRNTAFKADMTQGLVNYEVYLSGTTNGNSTLSAWHYALSRNCPVPVDFTCLRNKFLPNNTLSNCLTPEERNEAWKIFRGIYLSLKQQVVYIKNLEICSSGSNRVEYFRSLLEEPDKSKFQILFPSPNVQAQYIGLTKNDDSKDPDLVKNEINDKLDLACHTQCSSYEDTWREKLKGCLSNISQTVFNDLLEDLVLVCKGGCDQNNPYGSSSVLPKNSTFPEKSFKEVFEKYNIPLSSICSPDLLAFPLEPYHDYHLSDDPNTNQFSPYYVEKDASGNVVMRSGQDDCACNALKDLKEFHLIWSSQNPGCLLLHEFINKTFGTNYTQTDVDLLLDACRFRPDGGGIDNGTEVVLSPPINQNGQLYRDGIPTTIPPFPDAWFCKATNPACISCGDIAKLAIQFKNIYNAFPVNGHEIPEMFANFVNRKKGFNLTYPQFVDFVHSCNKMYAAFAGLDLEDQADEMVLPQFVKSWKKAPPITPLPPNNIINLPLTPVGTCACIEIYELYAQWLQAKQNNQLTLPQHEHFEDYAAMFGVYVKTTYNGGTLTLDDILSQCENSVQMSIHDFTDTQIINDETVRVVDDYCTFLKLVKEKGKLCQCPLICDVLNETAAETPPPVDATSMRNHLIIANEYKHNFFVIEKDVEVYPCSTTTCPTEKMYSICSDYTDGMRDFINLFKYLMVSPDPYNPPVGLNLLDYPLDLNTVLAYLKSTFNTHANLDPLTCTNNGINPTTYPVWFYDYVNVNSKNYFKLGISDGTFFQGWHLEEVQGFSDVNHIRDIRNITPTSVYTNGTQHFTIEILVEVPGNAPTWISTTGFTTNLIISDCCEPKRKICNEPLFTRFINPPSPCEAQLLKAAAFKARSQYLENLRIAEENFRAAYLERCYSAAPNEIFEMISERHEYHYTLYQYDVAGNLIQTVPPAGVQVLSGTQLDQVKTNRAIYTHQISTSLTPAHTLPTTYNYNTLNQLIWQHTPDAGESNFYYDNLGRIIFSQNAVQATRSTPFEKHYSYTRYDELGRIKEVGEMLYPVSLNNPASVTHTNSKIPADVEDIFSASNKREITKTFYDNAQYTLSFQQNYLRGRVAHTTFAKLQVGDYNSAVHYSYDIHGNVASMVREVKSLETPLGQSNKQVDYSYDLVSGKVNQVSYQAGEPDEFYHRYEYDADNRLTKAYTSTDAIHWDRDARYEYYKHGPLARTELGQHKVQGIDYAYTLHGWLKGVNSNTLNPQRDMGKDGYASSAHSAVARDVYGFTLNYYQSTGGLQDYLAINQANISGTNHFEANMAGSAFHASVGNLYNGNIKSMVVAIGKFMENNNQPLGYAYQYDQLNRLVVANSWNNVDLTNNEWSSTGAALVDYRNQFTYDANGNILTQVRAGGGIHPLQLDDLTYTYQTNTNRLTHVDDAVSSTNYTDDIDDQNLNNYQYDAIGNLIADAQEEIASIEWTVYGKIKRIIRTALSVKPDLEFEYSPDGHRICKIVKPKAGLRLWKYTYYVHDAQGNVLATYSRELEAIFDPEKVTFEQTNAALVSIEGGTNFNTFIQGLHPLGSSQQWLLDLKSALLASGYESQFIQHFDPTFILLSNSTLFNQVLQQFNPIILLNQMSNTYGLNTLYAQGCSSNGVPFIELSVNHAPLQFLMHLSVYNLSLLEQMYLDAGGMPSSPMPDANTMSTFILSTWNNTQIAQWIHTNLSCNSYSNLMMGMHSTPDLEGILLAGPYLTAIYTTHYTTQQIIDAFLATGSVYTWQLIYQFSASGYLLDMLYLNDMTSFYAQLNKTYWMLIGPQQQVQQPYTRTQYYSYIQAHFSSNTYQQLVDMFIHLSNQYSDKFVVNEWHIYGSSRIGTQKINRQLVQVVFNGTWNSYEGNFGTETNQQVTFYQPDIFRTALARGNKRYELTNHLGNVLVVISDKKLPYCTEGTADYYTAEVLQATDYSAFGVILEDRVYYATTTDKYRYGFNGKENDNEVEGDGNWQDYGMRMYSPRLAKFPNVDPITNKYPFLTPYQFASNTPIQAVDLDGREAFFIHGTLSGPETWSPALTNSITKVFTNNKHIDASFSWNSPSPGGLVNRNWILNSEASRNTAAKELVNHIIEFRQKNKIVDEEITLIGHSHGGNVAIQAAQMLYEKYGVTVNIIGLNVPAFNGFSDPENPRINRGINQMLNFYSDGDAVAGQIAPGSDDYYEGGGGFADVSNYKIEPLEKGAIDSHSTDNISVKSMIESGAKRLKEVFKGLRNPGKRIDVK